MKKNIFPGLIVLLAFFSCTKTDDDLDVGGGGGVNTPATINVINAIAGGQTAQLDGVSGTIAYGSFGQLSVNPGGTALHIYPVGDPSTTYFNNSVPTVAGGKYSLFLTGVPGNIGFILLQDSVHLYTDSTTGIRFVNLSPDAGSVSVNITGQSSGSVFHDYSFGSSSMFIKFPADSQHSGYTFQFRKADTDSLLLEYGFNSPLFHNVTVVFDGLLSNNSINAFLLNDD